MTPAVHISSVLLTARPRLLDDIAATLNDIDIAEVAHVDPLGKVIVTLETSSESEIVQALTDMQVMEGVVNASLVFHQIDEVTETPQSISTEN
ncbi:MAG: chaperone NapD [Burkholderiaceae bacterium]